MIFTLMIVVLCSVITAIINLFPTLPATPSAIVSGGQWFIDTIGGIVAVLNWLFTPTLLAAAVIVILAIISFEQVYHTILWAVKKIPLINIK